MALDWKVAEVAVSPAMELLSQNLQIQRPKGVTGVLAALGLVLAFLYVGRLFFITLVVSVILSFILEPVVGFFMRFRLPRPAASFLACSAALLVVYLAALGVYMQAVGLWEELPVYSKRIGQLVDSATSQLEGMEKTAEDILIPQRIRDRELAIQQQQQQQQQQAQAQNRRRKAVEVPAAPPPVQEVRIRPERESLVNQLYGWLVEFSDVLLMASFLPFLVYFMLSWSDHVRRTWLNLFSGERREVAAAAWEGIAHVARAYVVGNFLLGVLLAVASALFFWFAKLPYWQVVGPLSGFLSLVPYVGLPLALIPPLFTALPVYSNLTAYLIIATTVALFHLLALNLLYPKLVGGRVHLNPLVVTVALMFWYIVWGGVGLLLAIPITAGIKAVFESIPSLRAYGRLMGD